MILRWRKMSWKKRSWSRKCRWYRRFKSPNMKLNKISSLSISWQLMMKASSMISLRERLVAAAPHLPKRTWYRLIQLSKLRNLSCLNLSSCSSTKTKVKRMLNTVPKTIKNKTNLWCQKRRMINRLTNSKKQVSTPLMSKSKILKCKVKITVSAKTTRMIQLSHLKN